MSYTYVVWVECPPRTHTGIEKNANIHNSSSRGISEKTENKWGVNLISRPQINIPQHEIKMVFFAFFPRACAGKYKWEKVYIRPYGDCTIVFNMLCEKQNWKQRSHQLASHRISTFTPTRVHFMIITFCFSCFLNDDILGKFDLLQFRLTVMQ